MTVVFTTNVELGAGKTTRHMGRISEIEVTNPVHMTIVVVETKIDWLHAANGKIVNVVQVSCMPENKTRYPPDHGVACKRRQNFARSTRIAECEKRTCMNSDRSISLLT